MTITVSAVAVIRIIFLLMLFSIGATAYVQGWRLFCSRDDELDTADRIMGGGFLWAISLGCVGAIWAIVHDMAIL